MKKIVMTLCAVLVVFNTLCAQSGNWTDEGNYDISWYNDSEQSFTLSTPQEVAGIAVLAQNRKSLQYKTIYLSADIDLSAHYWVPISSLSGNIEGNNHTISSMYISGEYSTAGFIAVSGSDFIQNLRFNRCQLNIRFNTSGYQFGIGGIIGTHNLTSSNSLLLSNCHFNGEIRIEASKGNLLAGGILGCIYGKSKQPEIKECSNEASLQIICPSYIPSDSYTNNMIYAGGIVGACFSIIQEGTRLPGCKITKCRNKAFIDVRHKYLGLGHSNLCIGGIAGYTDSDLSDCLNQHTITVKDTTTNGTTRIGGIIGEVNDLSTSIITSCVNEASLSCSQQGSQLPPSIEIGGIVGNKSGEEILVVNSENRGEISAISNDGDVKAGGIAGTQFFGYIHACANHGSIIANSIRNKTLYFIECNSGGIIGNMGGGTIINSFNTGSIISATKNNRNASSQANAGGIAGILYDGSTPTTSPTIANCYNTGTIRTNGVNYYPKSYAGGIVGWTYSSTLTNNYNVGSVTAQSSQSKSYISAGGIVGYKEKDMNNTPSDILNNYYISSLVTPWKNLLGTDKTEIEMQTPGFAELLTEWSKRYTGIPEAFTWEIHKEENASFPVHINPLEPPSSIEKPRTENIQFLQISVLEQIIQITSPVTQEIQIYSLQGYPIRHVLLPAKVTVTIEDLLPGIYLIGQQKVIIN